MRYLLILFILLNASWSFSAQHSAPTTISSSTKFSSTKFYSQTRETDYTIGSIARQYLLVEVPSGYVLDEASLPEQGVTEAVELRDIHWNIEQDKTITRYKFEIDWQIFVAFDMVKSTQLRSLALVFKNAAQSITVAIPPDSVLVSNLLPPKMDAKHVQPYADIAPQRLHTQPLWLGVLLASFVLMSASLYMAWCMGWISFASEKAMPFRQAWRTIHQLALDKNSNDEKKATLEAMRQLAQAASKTAGYTVTHENLKNLLTHQAPLKKYAAELEGLFKDIQQTFFAGAAPQHTLTAVKKLAKQLSQLELSSCKIF